MTDSRDIYRPTDEEIPDLHDERESAGVEPALKRRLRRDVGADAVSDAADPRTQSRPIMALHVSEPEDAVRGILLVTLADFPHADRRRIREVVQERLLQAGFDYSADDVERILQRQPAARDE